MPPRSNEFAIEPITFPFGTFTPAQRAIEVFGFALMIGTTLLAITLIAMRLDRLRRGLDERTAKRGPTWWKVAIAAAVFLFVTQLEGAKALHLHPDRIAIEYRFRPTRTIPLASVRAVEYRHESTDRGRRGKRGSHQLILTCDTGEVRISPLGHLPDVLPTLLRARDAIQDRIQPPAPTPPR